MLTEKERKELIEELRESAPDWTVSGRKVHLACDELERLAAVTVQSEEQQKLCENLRDRNNVAYQDCEDAALEIERLTAELANANRLLEIGRRRSLEKSGGLEIDHSETERLEKENERLKLRSALSSPLNIMTYEEGK